MAKSAMAILLATACAGAAPIRPLEKQSELEGKWIVTDAITLGVVQENMIGTTFVIKGDQFAVVKPAPGSQGTVKIDNKVNPKRIQFVVQKIGDKEAKEKGGWIYELNAEELRMASFTNSDGAIPEKIDPTNRNQLVWTLKRAKD